MICFLIKNKKVSFGLFKAEKTYKERLDLLKSKRNEAEKSEFAKSLISKPEEDSKNSKLRNLIRKNKKTLLSSYFQNKLNNLEKNAEPTRVERNFNTIFGQSQRGLKLEPAESQKIMNNMKKQKEVLENDFEF